MDKKNISDVKELYVAIISLSMFLVCINVAIGQSDPGHGYPYITHYTPSEYNAMPENWAITQSNKGIMYFGNIAGVLEYDGVEWRLIPLANRSIARSLDIDKSGQIWVGGVGEFGYLQTDKNGFTQFKSILEFLPENLLGFDDVWDTHCLGEKVYFMSYKAIYIYHRTQKQFTTLPPGYLLKINEKILAKNRSGIYEIENDSLSQLPVNNLLSSFFTPGAVVYDEDNILLAAREAGLFLMNKTEIKPFKTDFDTIIKNDEFGLYKLIKLNNGMFALGAFGAGGILIFDKNGKLIKQFGETSGIPNSSYLFQDNNGVLWVAKIDGISKIELNSPYQIFDDRSGIVGRVRAAFNHNGTIYAAGDPYVWVKSPDSERFEVIKDLPAGQYWDIIEFNGTILVASNNVYQIKNKSAKAIFTPPGNRSAVTKFHFSKNNPDFLFLGLSGGDPGIGIIQHKNGEWINKYKIPGMEVWAYDINENPPGTIWAGSDANGAFKIDVPDLFDSSNIKDFTVKHYSDEDGLPLGELKTPIIDGAIRFSVMNNFIYQYNPIDDKFVRDSTFDKAYNHSSWEWAKLKEDLNGNVWIATGRGAAFATPMENGEYRIDKSFLSHFNNDMIYDFGGGNGKEIVFINENGLVLFDESWQAKERSKSNTIIRSIKAGNEINLSGGSFGFILPEKTVVHFKANSFRFEFSLSNYIDNSSNEFQTYLEGFDKEWSDWTRVPWKEYSQLREGIYVFHVKGRNLYQDEGTIETFTFEIKPPYYRSKLAFILYFSFFLLILEIGRRIIKKRIQIKERKKFILKEAQSKNEKLELESALLESEKSRMENELNVGRDIQMSMLPLIFPAFPEYSEFNIFAILEPAKEVGGDFYDFFFIDENKFLFLVADVSGKGVPAALFMAVCKTLIKSRAVIDSSPSSIITQVNEELSRENNTAMFVTLFLCIFDISTGKLSYTNAGHNPPHIKRLNGEIETLDKLHGPVVGALEEFAYGEDSVRLNVNDYMILFTDGVNEAMDKDKNLYGDIRLIESLKNNNSENVNDHVKTLYESVMEFQGDAEQADDITILGFEYQKPLINKVLYTTSITLQNEMEEIDRLNEHFVEFCESNQIPPKIFMKFNIVFDELINNVVSYAYIDDEEHTIEVTINITKHQIVVSIEDDGTAFNPFNMNTPNIEASIENREIGGLGVHIVKNLMDNYSYKRLVKKNLTTLYKNI